MSWRLLRLQSVVSRSGGRNLHRRYLVSTHRFFSSKLAHFHNAPHRHNLAYGTVNAFLMPPAIFLGLVLTLWTYKCLMMIIFQNKIVYMGGIPLGARKEKIADYTRRCRPIAWQEERIQASDRTEIALCVGSSAQSEAKSATDEDAIILYFQGNASSLPPRLPYLSDVLRSLSSTPSNLGPPTKIRYTLVAVSYRGFWTSQGRPSQKGIELDVAAALQWVERTYGTPGSNVNVVLWGQSIGAGIATTAAARYLAMHSLYKDPTKSQRLNIQALILETPFTSVGSMLIALYPQKWLPYRYLGPFLRNWWDSEAALHQIESLSMGAKPKILLLQSGQDELVPKEHGIALEDLCRHLGMDVDRKVVPGALHTEAMARGEGRSSISRFLRKIAA